MGLPALLGPLIGAGGSIFSAIMGADAQDQAQKYNFEIQRENLQDQQKARQEAIDYANGIRADQKKGGYDAVGNHSYFDPVKGWVTDLSPEQQKLYDYFYQQELPERRAQFSREATQSRSNADTADQLLQQFLRVKKELPQDAENRLYEKATEGIGEGARDVTEEAMMQATRTGNNNIANIISKLGAQTMKQRAAAKLNASLQADDYVDKNYNDQRGGIANLYQAFLGDSQKSLDPSYDPTNIPQSANKLLDLFSQQGAQGNSMGYNALTQPVPLRQPIEPFNASANAIGAIGSSLGSLGDRASSISNQSDMNDLLKQYITAGGQIDLSQGGLFGNVASRTVGNQGVY